MAIVLWGWLGLTAVTLLTWLSRHGQLSRARRTMPPLTSRMPDGPAGARPTVSWIVAAKDEAANIEACLRSMAAQDYPNLEIIAVNDRSEDQTGAIMDRLAAEHERLTVLHVAQLPPGWFGKNNAMRDGVARSTGEWLCFTDADCIQLSPRSLSVAMQYARGKGADFLSVLPAHETRGFWESVIQPACSGVLMIWFNPMRVNDPRRKTAYANGAFMLMKRACYQAIGGHEAVKTELNEDMHMARLAKERGLRLCVVSNVDLYTVRMYEGLRATWKGWSRIFFGCFGTMRRLVATATILVLFSLLPWITTAVGAAALAGQWRWPGWPVLTAVGAVACLMQWTVMFRFYRLNRLRPWYALFYPLGSFVGLTALIGAMRRVGGRSTVTWRGTTYRGDRVETAAASSAS